MKRLFWILLVELVFSCSIYCNNSVDSKIIFYRDHKFQGSAISYKVYVNDSMVIKLKDNSFYSYSCTPGEYDIMINKIPSTKIHLNIKTGETYYLRFELIMGVLTNKLDFIVVDSISAYPIINNSSIRELDIINTPLKRPKNRAGINIGGGGGFESFPMFITQDGKESKISFGGGLTMGIKYGHEFSKHFDVAADLIYKYSELSPTLNNADVSFERAIISITPSYIIPIDGGDAMRLKLGCGPDLYCSSIFTIEGARISGGFNDKWIYESTLGFHTKLSYELNLSLNWSFNYELNWYIVNYDFKSSDDRYPTVPKLKQPNGTGIDFAVGIEYHF